jgi:hypothetical protein
MWLRPVSTGGWGWSYKDAARRFGHSSSALTESVYHGFRDDELPTVPGRDLASFLAETV